jgi:hypothetical protein
MANNNEMSQFNFVCFRCGGIIKPDERMITVSVSLETPTRDNSIESIDCTSISSLCFPCAAILISKAVVSDDQLMMPPLREVEVIQEEETNIKEAEDFSNSKDILDILVNSIPSDSKADTALKVHCLEDGFCFKLLCSDGTSWANSPLFTWKQIAQLVIAADPDMFGVLDEPLHRMFPESLKRLGYYVPNWQE